VQPQGPRKRRAYVNVIDLGAQPQFRHRPPQRRRAGLLAVLVMVACAQVLGAAAAPEPGPVLRLDGVRHMGDWQIVGDTLITLRPGI